MENNKQEAIYCSKTARDPESLTFIVRLATTLGKQQFEFTSQLCSFVVLAKDTDGKYTFRMHTSEDGFLNLTRFKKCSIKNRKNTFTSSLVYRYFGDYELDEAIPREKLEPNAGCFELEFRFTDGRNPDGSVPKISGSQPSFPRIVVERLFYDSIGVDVTFVCDDILKEDCPSELEPADVPKQDPILSVVASLAVAESSRQGQPVVEKRGSAGSSASTTVHQMGSTTSVTRKFGAHKVVLAQWPYFKAMFSSDFVEGSSDLTSIRIKDVNAKTFKAMTYFIYVGEVESGPVEILKSHDPTQAADVSWEALYLAADRYRIDDLRKLALDKITENLSKMDAIELLFRSAYLFEELRSPVVGYIAKDRHAELAKKEIREKYMDHPEFCELLGEIYDAYHDLCRAALCPCK
ncbi:hypothetical protein BGZ82_011646 [Podila clonocystis]|nr:hypothetical protein BGZ82_011646 [Podila clonocystis]